LPGEPQPAQLLFDEGLLDESFLDDMEDILLEDSGLEAASD
jgi:hypothetical protein